MPSNKAVVACAGSGKTTFIVSEALKVKNSNVLITTYTNENIDQIKQSIIEQNGFIPPNIYVVPWFTFLLRDGVRPYQNCMSSSSRVESIFFQNTVSRFHRKDDYFTKNNYIYSTKLSEFVFECNKKSGGLVIKRLEKIYGHIFIDELQDFAGYDLNFFEELFTSSINIVAVGDPRQSTFATNNSSKNSKYRGSKIYEWLQEHEKNGNIIIEEKTDCHRCNQSICDFADLLYPNLPKTTSKNVTTTGHDGIFLIKSVDIEEYIKKHQPIILRYDKRTNTSGNRALNIGLSKGRTYARVLIFPTKNMVQFIKTKDHTKAGDISKLYVAITRAKHSIAFVVG
jgi:hypothetical protein